MTSKPKIRLRRAYDEPVAGDGIRVLVDRVWPRGLRKEDARIDEWYKDIAPSTELRKWYAHDPPALPSSLAATGPSSKIRSEPGHCNSCGSSPNARQ